MVDPIALYYPYIHVRDDTWLKYAALYWPRMARLRPREYPDLDSPVAQVLRNDAKWLTDIAPPRWAADQVGAPFLDLINTHTSVLRDRFGLNQIDQWESIASRLGHDNTGTVIQDSRQLWQSIPTVRRSAPRLDPRLGYVHADKIRPDMIDAAVDAGVAILVLDRPGRAWVGMHPTLASVYTCALIERIAIGDHLHPITDQTLPHAALSGWDLEHLVQVLIAEPSDVDTPRSSRDLLDAFVFLAFQTVVPAHLDTVSVIHNPYHPSL